MPQRSTELRVPKEMQNRFNEITYLTNTFSQQYLNEEYAQVCRELMATLLCQKRPSPLMRGKTSTWACGIVHATSSGEFSFRFLANPTHCGKPDLGVFRAQFFDHVGQIQADP